MNYIYKMEDKDILAGRDSGKSRTTENWLNKAEWELMKAWRHKTETKMWTFGINTPNEAQMVKFDKEYAEAYPDNNNILNSKDDEQTRRKI